MSDWAGELTVGLGWVYYNGPVGHTDFHQHYAVQICFPFSGPLHIETSQTNQTITIEHILAIGSNVSHRLSSSGQSATLLYIEPNLMAQNLSRLQLSGINELTLSQTQIHDIKVALNIVPASMNADFGRHITRIIWPQDTDIYIPIDPRIGNVLAEIDASDNLNIRLSQLAESTRLSESRFRHLFSAQIGMPLKSYLLWAKLQRAFQCLATDSSLTNAAHMAGFADSAHLSRTFKRMFGLTPGDLNKNARFTTRNPVD